MTLQAHLDAFAALRQPGPFAYPWSSTHGAGTSSLHLVIGSMVHGDECGSLPGVVRVMQELVDGTRTFAGKVTFFVGNPEAGLAGRRFLQADLNRVFVPEPPDNHEGRRARELKPILDSADVFLDLHQTILPTAQPFWIFPFQIPGWRWARALGAASVWVTRHPDQNFSLEGCCADEFVRLAGKPGITLELSQRGFGNGGEQLAYDVITRALTIGDAVEAGGSLAELAEGKPEIAFYETAHRERFATLDHALRPGLVNFAPVAVGDVLSADGTPPMVAPFDGCVLFPKYPGRDAAGVYEQPLPAEIYRVIRLLDGHPLDLYGLRGQLD